MDQGDEMNSTCDTCDDGYDSTAERDVYGGSFSCGEITLPDASGGSKKQDDFDASNVSGVSGFSYIVSTGGGDASSCNIPAVGNTKEDCTECAIAIDGPVCSGTGALVVLKKFAEAKDMPMVNATPETVVETAKKLTGCNTEECALRTIAQEDPSVRIVVAETIRDNFKVDGPADSTKWLNNQNIDSVLAQLCKKYPSIYHLPYQMIDFAVQPSTPTWKSLGDVNLVKDVISAGKNMFCVVINTDITGKPGKHWFCIFCDFRRAGTEDDPFTIEYFNSSGSRARTEIANWMHKMETEIESSPMLSGKHVKRVTAATIQHQKDTDSECGVYALYYIYRRIKGAPIEEFGTRIPDAQMVKFRSKLFRNRQTSPAN